MIDFELVKVVALVIAFVVIAPHFVTSLQAAMLECEDE